MYFLFLLDVLLDLSPYPHFSRYQLALTAFSVSYLPTSLIWFFGACPHPLTQSFPLLNYLSHAIQLYKLLIGLRVTCLPLPFYVSFGYLQMKDLS